MYYFEINHRNNSHTWDPRQVLEILTRGFRWCVTLPLSSCTDWTHNPRRYFFCIGDIVGFLNKKYININSLTFSKFRHNKRSIKSLLSRSEITQKEILINCFIILLLNDLNHISKINKINFSFWRRLWSLVYQLKILN